MSDIQTKLDSLDALRELSDDTEKQIVGYQNDDNLVALLEKEYPKVSKASTKNILKLVKGKKGTLKVVGDNKKTLENKLLGQCFLNDVNPIDNKGKFVGYAKLKHRISQRKSKLKEE
jgi:hypothetical protein